LELPVTELAKFMLELAEQIETENAAAEREAAQRR
jgi:hypothetical protein